MLSDDFLAEFKRITEAKWKATSLNLHIYGFQFQPGTRWNPGLSKSGIAEYEAAAGVSFPHDFKAFLGAMNGTDIPTLNVYGSCGEPFRESCGVYAYPRDLGAVKRRIENLQRWQEELGITMAGQDFELQSTTSLMPLYGNRCVICAPDLTSSVVLAVEDEHDAIVYGNSLQEYLQREFLSM